MKSFLLMSAAWLSGAGGDPTLAPAPAPIAYPAPIVGTAPAGPCCGNKAPQPAPVYHPAPTYAPQAVQSVVSGGISGSCDCDPCAQATPAAAPAPAPRHLFHRLFGKKPAAPAAAPAPSTCGCEAAPVVGGSCGCGAPATATAAPAPSGGLFSRFFGSKPAPAPAPIYSGSVISAAPACSNCGQPHLLGGVPVTGVIQSNPAPYPQAIIQPGTSLPTVGTPPTTPAVETPMTPSTPLPKGPEKIKVNPKEPMKLPSEGERGLQPASGTRIESGGRLPF